jgi:hypothetical protein
MYSESVSVYRGEVVCVRRLHITEKVYYLCIHPDKKVVSIYSKMANYPGSPKEVITMNSSCKFELTETPKGWFMKNSNLTCFAVSSN